MKNFGPRIRSTSPTTRFSLRNFDVASRLLPSAITALENMEKSLDDLTFIISSMDSQLVLGQDATTQDTRARLVKYHAELGEKVTFILVTLQRIQSPM